MAREAVHQAPDPHLDRHLQRMGLVDSPDPADRGLAQPVLAPVESGVTVQLLERRLRRAEISVAVLGIIVVVLALIEVNPAPPLTGRSAGRRVDYALATEVGCVRSDRSGREERRGRLG